MRFRPFICLSLALAPVVFLPACRSSGKDKLETTIRARDQRIYDLQNDVDKLAGYNLALQTEVRAIYKRSVHTPVSSKIVGGWTFHHCCRR